MNFINSIIKYSLNNKLFVLIGAVLLIVAGTYSSQRMDIDVFPDLTAPTVVVMTDARGISSDGERRICRPYSPEHLPLGRAV